MDLPDLGALVDLVAEDDVVVLSAAGQSTDSGAVLGLG
jgi:hypothetical protein